MKRSLRIFLALIALSLASFSLQASEFRNWILAYHHDDSGNAISGTYSALVDAIQAGADVRLGFVPVNGKPTSFRNPATVAINGNEVIALHQIPTADLDGSGNLTLLAGLISRELFSTRGKRELEMYHLNGTPYLTKAVQSREIFWFVSK